MTEASSSVPCGTCSLCCHGHIFLHPDEDAKGLPTVTDRRVDGMMLRRLLQNPDGSCSHLVEGRCSVYERRPRICRIFDCREHYHLPAAQRRRIEALLTDDNSKAVIARGRFLVESARDR